MEAKMCLDHLSHTKVDMVMKNVLKERIKEIILFKANKPSKEA